MSLVLSGANYVRKATPVTSFPKTFVFWFKTSDVSQGGSNAIMLSDDDGSTKQNQCQLRGDQSPNYPIAIASYNSAWAYTFCASPYPQNSTWHCAAVVFTSDTNREVYLDGASYAQTTTSQNSGSTSWLNLGCRFGSGTPGVYYTGQLAHLAVWNIALNSTEIASLAGGTNPQDVQYANLQIHHTLKSDGTDELGGSTFTEIGSPTYNSSDDPPVSPPGGGGTTEYAIATLTGEGSMSVELLVTHRPEVTMSGAGSMLIAPDSSTIYNMGTVMDDPGVADHPGWDAGAIIGGLTTHSTPRPTETADLPGLGTEEAMDTAPMDQNEFTGLHQYSGVEDYWFEQAHLIPRLEQALGNIISDTSVDCELYNADRNNAITVSSVIEDLATGVTVTGVPSTPFNIESQTGLPFTVNISVTGGFAVDSTYTLVLSTGEEYVISITGTRIVLLPIRPEAPLREHIQFDTQIIPKLDGTEQRIAGRQYPRGMFEMTVSTDRRRMELFLFDRQSKILAVPAWHEPSFVTSAITAGDTTVNVNETAYANFYVGGFAIVFTDQYTYDTREITAITGTTIEFDKALSNSYPVKTQVMPLMAAYVEPTTSAIKALNNDQEFRLRVKVLATENDIADTSAWNTFGGKVLLDGPNVVDGGALEESFATDVFVLDNTTGVFSQYALWEHSKRSSQKGFVTKNRQELWELRQLLHALQGRQVTFYIPTFSKDILPNQALAIGSTGLIMDNVGYTVNAYQRESKKYIRVHLIDGTVLDREIVDSSEVDISEEQIVVSSAWPYTIEIEDIDRIEFLSEVRLDTDDIVLIHYNALGLAKCMVAVKEVSS